VFWVGGRDPLEASSGGAIGLGQGDEIPPEQHNEGLPGLAECCRSFAVRWYIAGR